MYIGQKHVKYPLWSLAWWSSHVHRGGPQWRSPSHRGGLSWRYVLVVRVAVIRCGRVVLVCRRRHCP